MPLINVRKTQVHISISEDLIDFLDVLVAKKGTNRSQVIEEAVREHNKPLFEAYRKPAKNPIFRRN